MIILTMNFRRIQPCLLLGKSKEISLPRKSSSNTILLAALFLLTIPCGCSFTVIPPPLPVEPAPVFLLDHGGHSSLVLPADEGMVRYSYGDWEWYALGQTGAAKGSRALVGPNPAGLSRKMLAISPTEDAIRQALPISIENIFLIPAEAENVARLRGRLEAIFLENRGTLHHNPNFGLDFVRHPEPYSLSHNSNTVVAGWLRELGAEVRGSGPFSNWKIERER